MKVRMETLHPILYNLKMMDISKAGSSYVYGDNMLVTHNTSKPESTLKKKCNAIAYHAICKSVAMGKSWRGHVRSEDNPSDLLTKVVTGHKRKHLVPLVLYGINDGDT